MLKAELSAGKMGVKIDSLICGNPTSKIIISNDGTFTQGLLDCPGELFQASGELAGLSGRYTYEFSQEEALLHLDFV